MSGRYETYVIYYLVFVNFVFILASCDKLTLSLQTEVLFGLLSSNKALQSLCLAPQTHDKLAGNPLQKNPWPILRPSLQTDVVWQIASRPRPKLCQKACWSMLILVSVWFMYRRSFRKLQSCFLSVQNDFKLMFQENRFFMYLNIF